MSTADPTPGIAGVFDRAADTYGQADADFFESLAAAQVATARLAPGERVLDVGCGRGAVTFAAREAVGSDGNVVATDLAPRMVELTAAEVARRGWTNVEVRVGDADDPQVPGPFDAVLAGLVLFFLPDPAATLRRWAALLRDGGRIAFTSFGARDEVSDAAVKAVAAFGPTGTPSRAPSAAALETEEQIGATVSRAGLSVERLERVDLESTFADAEHWWRWMWSHGGRALLERVPAERVDEAKAAAAQALEKARRDGGEIVLVSTAYVVVVS